MSRLGGWFRANARGDSDGEASITEKERRDIVEAMGHAQLIMNDDLDGAYKALKKGDSSFHRLGTVVTYFMRAVLGMEKQVMAETVDMLNECEAKAWDDSKAAERRGRRGDSIYPPGAEYELVRAETQLMGAVVGVLHESLMEAMKSFYKLRKAFVTLDAIMAVEARALEDTATINEADGVSRVTEVFVDANAKEHVRGPQPPVGQTQPSTSLKDAEANSKQPDTKLESGESGEKSRGDMELTFDDPVDIFISSGANMCFGILTLMLTLVPPSFGRILSVVGFRGDRAKGVDMLWRSSTHDNINGAVAGMTLLAYYNGLLGTVDILPHPRDYDEAAETVGPPREKCERLLETMRQRYPDSQLWRVEEARRQSSERDLRGAIKTLTGGHPSKMKQIAALTDFELALDAMFVQDWPLMRDSFLRCVETNDWSPALYWFQAGCASLELYRDALHAGDVGEARRQKHKADGYLRKAPTVAGKKAFMAKKLPLETFLQRKLQRWEERAKELDVELVDAVGVSPALEFSYLWNGTKRMGDKELLKSVDNMSWERCTCGELGVKKMKAEEDEMGVWAVCMAAIRRRQCRFEEAREMLEEHVMKHDRSVFKGTTRNDYLLPAATYELGAIAWEECCGAPAAYRKKKLEECESYLEKVKNWEAYVLDMRIGVRVQSGLETIKWFREKMGWTA